MHPGGPYAVNSGGDQGHLPEYTPYNAPTDNVEENMEAPIERGYSEAMVWIQRANSHENRGLLVQTDLDDADSYISAPPSYNDVFGDSQQDPDTVGTSISRIFDSTELDSETSVLKYTKNGRELFPEAGFYLPLPSGWEIIMNETTSDKPVFVDHNTRTIHNTDPRPLPPDWEQMLTGDGIAYFVDHKAKKSFWTHPCAYYLPGPHWQIMYDPDDHLYFIDHKNKRNFYTLPDDTEDSNQHSGTGTSNDNIRVESRDFDDTLSDTRTIYDPRELAVGNAVYGVPSQNQVRNSQHHFTAPVYDPQHQQQQLEPTYRHNFGRQMAVQPSAPRPPPVQFLSEGSGQGVIHAAYPSAPPSMAPIHTQEQQYIAGQTYSNQRAYLERAPENAKDLPPMTGVSTETHNRYNEYPPQQQAPPYSPATNYPRSVVDTSKTQSELPAPLYPAVPKPKTVPQYSSHQQVKKPDYPVEPPKIESRYVASVPKQSAVVPDRYKNPLAPPPDADNGPAKVGHSVTILPPPTEPADNCSSDSRYSTLTSVSSRYGSLEAESRKPVFLQGENGTVYRQDYKLEDDAEYTEVLMTKNLFGESAVVPTEAEARSPPPALLTTQETSALIKKPGNTVHLVADLSGVYKAGWFRAGGTGLSNEQRYVELHENQIQFFKSNMDAHPLGTDFFMDKWVTCGSDSPSTFSIMFRRQDTNELTFQMQGEADQIMEWYESIRALTAEAEV